MILSIFIKKWKIFSETFIIVVFILIAKYFILKFGLEFLAITPLHTSAISGGIFVLGFILAGAYSDYKESEKIPADIVTAVENIHQDSIIFHQQYREFDIKRLQKNLLEILTLFKTDLLEYSTDSLSKTKELSVLFLQLEKLGIPANYVVRLKQDQSIIIKNILRVNYIQRIQLIPSAFILVESIVIILLILLAFTKIGDLGDSLAILGFISFVFIYLLKLIRIIEKPFHPETTTMDDVSLFQIDNIIRKLQTEK